MQARRGKIGDPDQDLGEPGLGIKVVEAIGRDHRQHDGGTVGATLATSEGLVAPSPRQCLSMRAQRIRQADLAIVEEAGEVVPPPEHVIHKLQDLGGAREGFALSQQSGVHILEKRLAPFPGAGRAARRRPGRCWCARSRKRSSSSAFVNSTLPL